MAETKPQPKREAKEDPDLRVPLLAGLILLAVAIIWFSIFDWFNMYVFLPHIFFIVGIGALFMLPLDLLVKKEKIKIVSTTITTILRFLMSIAGLALGSLILYFVGLGFFAIFFDGLADLWIFDFMLFMMGLLFLFVLAMIASKAAWYELSI
jgi:hypothetical protein